MRRTMTRAVCGWSVLLMVLLGAGVAGGRDPLGAIAERDFSRLLAEIKPQLRESPWRDIAWLTNITEARRRALAEDKPLLIFTAADGSPLSRT
jgi:hypothetical protein